MIFFLTCYYYAMVALIVATFLVSLLAVWGKRKPDLASTPAARGRVMAVQMIIALPSYYLCAAGLTALALPLWILALIIAGTAYASLVYAVKGPDSHQHGRLLPASVFLTLYIMGVGLAALS